MELEQPDIIYTDILPRDTELYANQPDELCHKLEATTGIDGELRYTIKVWLKEENQMEMYQCQVCGKFIPEDAGITTLNGLWVCDEDSCRTLDEESQATEKL